MLDFEIASTSVATDFPTTKLVVIGVGGAGNNTINALINSGRCDYTCVAVNTDIQALDVSHAPHRIRIGLQTTKGRGAGADPLLGRVAAEEDLEHIINVVKDADLVFLVGGLGGGTGSGALPVIARALKELGIVNICIVTKPFSFEGKRRMLIADQAIELLRDTVDTLVVIPNEKLLQVNQGAPLSFVEACNLVNNMVSDHVRAIGDIITKPGYMNVDFADVKTVIKGQGTALMGTARAQGENRAIEAAHAAITSPFLDITTIRGARSILVNITGNHSLSLQEVQQAVSRITEDCDEHANIIIGSVIDETMGDAISINVIATGFDPHSHEDRIKARQSEARYAFQQRPVTENKPIASASSSVPASPSSFKESSITLTREQVLRDVLDLDTPAFLRKLSKESTAK